MGGRETGRVWVRGRKRPVSPGSCRGQFPGHGVMEVIVSSEIPDVGGALARSEHPQEHVDSHLFVCIWGGGGS